MRYKDFIETFFVIDDPKTGELVPFKFNKVQEAYYNQLCQDYKIEKNGIGVPVRELILKARRMGFSSLILAIFAADDLMSKYPTQTLVISYKEDATKVFRWRYKNFILSYFKNRFSVLDERKIFKINEDAEKVLLHNGARFYCGTASARVGERGGVNHKILFSEAAFYPDLERITAQEIIEGTMRQVDLHSGMIFIESTGNGEGNYFANLWNKAVNSQSRFKPRFFSWREFYTTEEFELIKSEFADDVLGFSIKREYPDSPEDALYSHTSSFVSKQEIEALVDLEVDKSLVGWVELNGVDYISQAEILSSSLAQVEKNNFGRNLYVGIDVAKVNDSTVMTIISEKAPFGSRGGVKIIAIDATGVGDYLPDWFKQNTNWLVEKVKLTSLQNDIMYKNLYQVIKNKLTKIVPVGTAEYEKFLKQMISLRVEKHGEFIRVGAPEGQYHDDYCDSFALAELGYITVNGLPKPSVNQQKESNLDEAVRRLLNYKRGAAKRRSLYI